MANLKVRVNDQSNEHRNILHDAIRGLNPTQARLFLRRVVWQSFETFRETYDIIDMPIHMEIYHAYYSINDSNYNTFHPNLEDFVCQN